MAALLIKDIPREVHEWLKREAEKKSPVHDPASHCFVGRADASFSNREVPGPSADPDTTDR